MSDLYDSLEDESDEIKYSSVSPDSHGTSDTFCRESESTDKYSFFLNGNVSEERVNFLSEFHGQNKNFLPKIVNKVNKKGVDSIQNIFFDNQILNKQDSQINDDGSFTKSPRSQTEELPFITRNYRNLQFQKKKTYQSNKNTSSVKIQKEISSGAPTFKIKLNQAVSRRRKENAREESFTKASPASTETSHTRRDKRFVENNKSADSVKRKSFQSQTGTPHANGKTAENFRKPKHLTSIQSRKYSQLLKSPDEERIAIGESQSQPYECLKKNPSFLNNNKRRYRHAELKISKHGSDVLLNTVKPKLNYLERHLLEKGFNPLHLRQLSKRVLSDTNRSNFGDSTVEQLSGVSSAGLSCDRLTDEDEELFYQRLIEKDKNMKAEQKLHSFRSDGPFELKTPNRLNGSNSQKTHKEVKEIHFLRCKRMTKSLSIDLACEGENSFRGSKKVSHYCSADSSPNLSKTELALKAKTYGYLANARNIFKLKARSEGKFSGKNQDSEVSRFPKKVSSFSPDGGKLCKHNSLPVNRFPSVKGESRGNLEASPRATKSLCKTKQAEKSRESFALPQVQTTEIKSGHIQSEILQRVSHCLRRPNS